MDGDTPGGPWYEIPDESGYIGKEYNDKTWRKMRRPVSTRAGDDE